MSDRIKAVFALWPPAAEGATWAMIDAAWWVLLFGLELAERLDAKERS